MTNNNQNGGLTVGLVQQACTEDSHHNLQRSIDGIRRAADQGARLVLLQELHQHRYFCKHESQAYFALAEPVPGPTTDAFSSIAKAHGVVIVASLFERRASGLYHNTAAVLDSDGSLAGRYRKMHIPDDPGYQEKFYFAPGDLGFTPVDTAVGRIGVLICWDQWYPEAARMMALAGAELLAYPTAIGWDPRDDEAEQQRQLQAWQTIQRAHAVANGMPVLCCNRTGFEADPSGAGNHAQFWGRSFIAGPQGEVLAEAGGDQEQVLVTRLPLKHCESVRQTWPFLRDRRIDAYADLSRRYRD